MFAIKYGAKIDGWRYLDKVYLLVLLVFYIELDRFVRNIQTLSICSIS